MLHHVNLISEQKKRLLFGVPPFVKEEMASLFKKFVVGDFVKAGLHLADHHLGRFPASEIVFVERKGRLWFAGQSIRLR